MDNFLKNDWRKRQAEKRGGGQTIIRLDLDWDLEFAEQRYQHEPVQSATAEDVFERNWAITVLNQVLESLRQQYVDSGKESLFEAFKGSITGDANVAQAEIADHLDMKVGAIKVAIHRLRERYRQQLRIQIARTLGSAEEVDEELRELFKALSAG